jgi:hypothetical protein
LPQRGARGAKNKQTGLATGIILYLFCAFCDFLRLRIFGFMSKPGFAARAHLHGADAERRHGERQRGSPAASHAPACGTPNRDVKGKYMPNRCGMQRTVVEKSYIKFMVRMPQAAGDTGTMRRYGEIPRQIPD